MIAKDSNDHRDHNPQEYSKLSSSKILKESFTARRHATNNNPADPAARLSSGTGPGGSHSSSPTDLHINGQGYFQVPGSGYNRSSYNTLSNDRYSGPAAVTGANSFNSLDRRRLQAQEERAAERLRAGGNKQNLKDGVASSMRDVLDVCKDIKKQLAVPG